MAAGYDIIGDIQGESEALETLLHDLGYVEGEHGFAHTDGDRQAIFVGDFVDRGHSNRRVLDIARTMVETGNAQAIMGNHELDHVRYATTMPNGKFVIPHDGVKDTFLKTCLDELPFGTPEHQDMVDWFKNLPVLIETDDFVVVHASYDAETIDELKRNLQEDNTLPEGSFGSERLPKTFNRAMNMAIKGPNVGLPHGVRDSLIKYETETIGQPGFTAQRGIRRIYWWQEDKVSPQESLGLTELDLSEEHVSQLQRVMGRRAEKGQTIATPDKPVFFGHYELGDEPHLTSDKAVCLDFKGKVTAYRYNEGDGQEVFPDRIVSVDTIPEKKKDLAL